jgi:hypothetical protein
MMQDYAESLVILMVYTILEPMGWKRPFGLHLGVAGGELAVALQRERRR